MHREPSRYGSTETAGYRAMFEMANGLKAAGNQLFADRNRKDALYYYHEARNGYERLITSLSALQGREREMENIYRSSLEGKAFVSRQVALLGQPEV
jgi:hypothetical protein